MLVTVFLFVCVHATGKYLVAGYPVAQVIWGRYAVHLALVAVILGPRLARVARSANLRLQLVRSGFMLGATAFYFAGVGALPLADANAIAFTTPVFVVILAPIVLGEHVGPRRWLGVAGGFAGALVVARPGSGVADVAALLMLASALSNACYQTITRRIGGSDEPLTTLLYTAVVGTAATTPLLPAVWRPMDGEGWAVLAAMGAFACAGHFALIKAYRAAEAPVVAPYNYANLLWATLLGFLVFGDLPDLWTVAGATLIVASGLYIWRRERAVAVESREKR